MSRRTLCLLGVAMLLAVGILGPAMAAAKPAAPPKEATPQEEAVTDQSDEEPESVETLSEALQNISDRVLKYAILLAAVGTVSMALIELFKSFFNVRMLFNSWRVDGWIRDANENAYRDLIALASGSKLPLEPEPSWFGTVKRIIAPKGAPRPHIGEIFSPIGWLIGFLLGQVDSSNVLFDQPSEQMAAQFRAAIAVVLEYPHLHEELYRFLAEADEGTPFSDATDEGRWFLFKKSADTAQADEGTARLASEARKRLTGAVMRRVDTFQAETQSLWTELNQRMAVIVGIAVALIVQLVVLPSDGTGQDGPGAADWARMILLSVVGGMVAPFAKDIVSALSGMRTKGAS